jgi:hypothetical protein
MLLLLLEKDASTIIKRESGIVQLELLEARQPEKDNQKEKGA